MIQFIFDNLSAIFGVILATQLAATAVVNLTPTPSDDIAVGKFYRVVEIIAGIWSSQAKLLPGESPTILTDFRVTEAPETFQDLAKDLFRIPR